MLAKEYQNRVFHLYYKAALSIYPPDFDKKYLTIVNRSKLDKVLQNHRLWNQFLFLGVLGLLVGQRSPQTLIELRLGYQTLLIQSSK